MLLRRRRAYLIFVYSKLTVARNATAAKGGNLEQNIILLMTRTIRASVTGCPNSLLSRYKVLSTARHSCGARWWSCPPSYDHQTTGVCQMCYFFLDALKDKNKFDTNQPLSVQAAVRRNGTETVHTAEHEHSVVVLVFDSCPFPREENSMPWWRTGSHVQTQVFYYFSSQYFLVQRSTGFRTTGVSRSSIHKISNKRHRSTLILLTLAFENILLDLSIKLMMMIRKRFPLHKMLYPVP